MALPSLLEGSLRLPLIGAPMFIVSGPELVIAQCNAGIVGSFPALNARPQEALVDWIRQIKEASKSYQELALVKKRERYVKKRERVRVIIPPKKKKTGS